jgi:hypothetical protein
MEKTIKQYTTNIDSDSENSNMIADEIKTDFTTDLGGADSRHIVHDKFDINEWERIEKKASIEDMLVFNAQKTIGALNPESFDPTKIMVTKLMSCGEDQYVQHVRPKLVELQLLPIETQIKSDLSSLKSKIKMKKKNPKKKSMTAQEIILASNIKLIVDETVKALQAYKTRKETMPEDEYINRTKTDLMLESTSAFQSKYVEIRLIGLIIMSKNLLSLEKKDIEAGYELINGSKKALVSSEKYEGVASSLLKDLEQKIKELEIHYNFTPKVMIHSYPRLFLSTGYDWIFPTMAVQAYQSQVSLMETIKTNYANGVLVFLKSMIGSGKTTSVAAIGQLVIDLREESEKIKKMGKTPIQDNSKLQLLFICSVEPVRHQVGYINYNCGYHQGIATQNIMTSKSKSKTKSGAKIKITNQFHTTDENRTVVISDLYTGLELLKGSYHKGELNNWIVFIDEPTVGSDQTNHPVTTYVAQLMELTPKITILSSATMPLPDQIPEFVDLYKGNNPAGKIIQIVSTETKIGCEIIDHNGDTVAPHTDVKTVDELKKVILRVQSDPFLGRLYTPPMMYMLYQKMKDNGISDLINPDEFFNSPKNQSQNKVQKFALNLLQILVSTDCDDLVEKICVQQNILVDIKDEIKDCANNEDNYEEEEEENNTGVVFFDPKVDGKKEETTNRGYSEKNIFTTDAYKFTGNCLIAVDNPIDFVLTAGKVIINTLQEKTPIRNLINNYESELTKYKKNLAAFEAKHNIKSNESGRFHGKIDTHGMSHAERQIAKKTIIKDHSSQDKKIMRKDIAMSGESMVCRDKKGGDKMIIQENAESLIKPIFKFPKYLQINTVPFWKLFSPWFIKDAEEDMVRINTTDIPHDLGVSDEILIMLYAGVGVFSYNYPLYLSNKYLDLVLDMASQGELAFVVSDDTICYGANYPFKRVIVLGNRAEKHSFGTLFQLFGRAGRVGRSWEALAYLTDQKTRDRFMEYMRGDTDGNKSVEANNLTIALRHVTDKRQAIQQKLKQKELEMNKINKRMAEERVREEARKKLMEEEARRKKETEDLLAKQIEMNEWKRGSKFVKTVNYNKDNNWRRNDEVKTKESKSSSKLSEQLGQKWGRGKPSTVAQAPPIISEKWGRASSQNESQTQPVKDQRWR